MSYDAACTASCKSSPENVPSLLLSEEENRLVFDNLGKGRQTLSTAIGRLVMYNLDRQKWESMESTGIICLVRDTIRKSYFIEIISWMAKNLILRRDILNQFGYEMRKPTIMMFDVEGSMFAIVFANSTEATNFREALQNKLKIARQRQREQDAMQALDWSVSSIQDVTLPLPPPPVSVPVTRVYRLNLHMEVQCHADGSVAVLPPPSTQTTSSNIESGNTGPGQPSTPISTDESNPDSGEPKSQQSLAVLYDLADTWVRGLAERRRLTNPNSTKSDDCDESWSTQ